MVKTKTDKLIIFNENINKNLIDVEKLEINNLPDGVKVATMCASCVLGVKLELDNIEKYMSLHENDILTIKRSKENIRTLIELKKPTKRSYNPKYKEVNNNFYNSITLIVRVTTGPTPNINLEPRINIKLFKNGSLQMSGCKNVENINIVLGKILEKLKAVKGKIENNIIKEITFIDELSKIAINYFKIDMPVIKNSLDEKRNWRESIYWWVNSTRAKLGYLDTWDGIFSDKAWRYGFKCLIPADNLVTNFGFRQDGTHTKNSIETNLIRLNNDTYIDTNIDDLLVKHYFRIRIFHSVTPVIRLLIEFLKFRSRKHFDDLLNNDKINRIHFR